MRTYPKSPKEMTRGMMYFPRMLDKIRLHLRGELHEDYQENFGGLKAADGVCCNFLRVHHRDLIERVKQDGADEEILEWCFENGRRVKDGDLFRAYHSDVADTPFATVQDLNSSDRKYAYVIWKLSDDGKNLRLRSVNDKVVPKETKDSATIVALLTKNARNPELFGEEIEFKKEK